MLNTSEDIQAKAYCDKLYSGVRPGYNRFGPTWEIPKWIAEVAYNFPEADVLFADSLREVLEKMCEYDDLAFSALDCNKHFIHDIAKRFTGDVYVGGYCSPEYFQDCDNVYCCDDIAELCWWNDVSYKPGVDYRHFAGAKTIARLTMSTGCNNRCKFCTVSSEVTQIPFEVIKQEIGEILELNSPLVYIDDKTFGQCPNYDLLEPWYKGFRVWNPDFDGFIIQTTPSQLLKLDDDFLLQSGIRYVELGIESYNDEILQAMNKPASEKTIQDAVDKLKRLNIKVIPNIMIGLPGETRDTYKRTIAWLFQNQDVISHVNVYTYVDYSETKTADENRGGDSELDKSFAKAVYDFGNLCLDKGVGLCQ